MGHKLKVLITAKTYPHPSTKYAETVCTGGVLEDGTWIRLYPIDFRHRPKEEQYHKYQWVEVEVERNPKDRRAESYRLVPSTKICPLGKPLKDWAQRRKLVLAKGTQSMCGLQASDHFACSLGVVKPVDVRDIVVRKAEKPKSWSAKDQYRLAFDETKPLDWIPFSFSYRYICRHPACPGHNMIITDWEVGMLYRRMYRKHRDIQKAAAIVRERLVGEWTDKNVDLHLFVGTINNYPRSWIVVGRFIPRIDNERQLDIFQEND